MKTGKTIQELATELTSIQANRRDFIAPTRDLFMNPDSILSVGDMGSFEPNNYSHGQVATYSGVPKTYYDKILGENSNLLSQMVNHGFQQEVLKATVKRPANRMVRTVGGKMRAMLSSRYRPLDCIDLLESALPVIMEQGQDIKVKSTELTEARMYLKMVMPKLEGEITKGDPVQYGLVISSSDVGAGSVRIEPLIYRLVCTNGLITESAMRKMHIGRNQAADAGYELLTDATRELSDQAFWAQVQDIIRGSMQPEIFDREVNILREAAGMEIKNDTQKVVELTAKELGIASDGVKQSMVQYLANGADGAGYNKWGLINAVTHAAQADDVDYDTSTDLERSASKILDFSGKTWERIAA